MKRKVDKINKNIDQKQPKESFFKLLKSSFDIIVHYSKKNKVLLLMVLLLSFLSVGSSIYAMFEMGNTMQKALSSLAYIPAEQVSLRNQYFNEFIISVSVMGALYLVSFITNYLQQVLLVRISQNIGFFIREDLVKKLQKISILYLDKKNVGDLMSRFTNDVDTIVVTFSQSLSQIINAVLTTIGVVIILFLINPILASISIGIIPLLFLFIIFFIRKSQPYFAKQQKAIGKINGDVEEFLFAHKMTTLFKYENEVIDIFAKKNEEYKNVSSKAQLISGMIYPYNNFINNFSISIIAAIQCVLIVFKPDLISITAISGFSPAIVISMFVIFLRQLTSQISAVFTVFNQFQLAFAGLARIKEILIAPNEVNNNKNLTIKHADVEFDDVTFGYDPQKPVINGIDFKAKENTMNAIVGPTGSGKTTIISLLVRFYDLNKGKISIDGKDISEYSRESVRKHISIVLQDSFMFNNTIMENIRFGRLNATDKEVIKAAKLANAHKFISKLPDGYNTKISNTYELLSEGEKQLISIARAFLSNAKILILDEATSYVDTKTEKDIKDAMNKLMKKKTSFVIAHRLSTIRDADNIIVIKDGKLLESGNHEELMKLGGFYAKMNNALNDDIDAQ